MKKAKEPRKGGTPRFVPTDDERALVKLLTANGYAQARRLQIHQQSSGFAYQRVDAEARLYSRVEGQNGRTMCILARIMRSIAAFSAPV